MSEPTPRVRLLAKLHQVAEAIDHVEKRGYNDHHKYNFAQAVDVVRTVRGELLKHKIIVLPGANHATHYSDTGGKGFLTTVLLDYRICDVETGEEINVPWVATGADVGGDKGLYKAFTGGLKYMLISCFLLPMTDDPEHDQVTDSDTEERPAAPKIPADRARRIADKAQEVQIAVWAERENGPDEFVPGPVLQAKLAELGVSKIGQLNVDQAENLEKFLNEEEANVTAR